MHKTEPETVLAELGNLIERITKALKRETIFNVA